MALHQAYLEASEHGARHAPPAVCGAARQIVFIDAAVANAAAIVAAAQPDVRTVILSPDTDGLEQIAGYLAAHGARGLAAISLVGHGHDGALRLGATWLSAGTLADHAAGLAATGAALARFGAPGGDLRLYGCGVARSAHGVAFLAAVAAAAGGVTVAAASGPVGSAARGGGWTLDVTTGPVRAPAPFDASRISTYPHALATNTVDLFYTADSSDTASDNELGELTATGTVGADQTTLDGGFANDSFSAEGIAIDAAAQTYFFAYYDLTDNTSELVIGSLAGGPATTLTVGSPGLLGLTAGTDFIDGLAVDHATDTLYLAVSSNTATNNGVWALPESGGTATKVATSASVSNPTDISLDTSNSLAFFVDQSVLPGIGTPENNIDYTTLSGTGGVKTLIVGSTSTSAPQITNLAVDGPDGAIYYTEHAENGSGDVAADSAIVKATYTVANHVPTLTATTTLYAGVAAGDPAGIVLDVPDGVFYVEDNATKTIDEGSLTGAFALTAVTNSTVGAGGVATTGDLEYLAMEVACFLAGTRLLTESGPVAVEALRIGDRLVTCDGRLTGLEPIVWIGSRRLDLGTHPHPEQIRPIRIRADAVAPGVPARDLLVSPDHALLLDGVLVAARQLVNASTIAPEMAARRITYFHVELPRHAVILAEGLTAESYLESGARASFAEAGAPLILHPDFSGQQPRAARSCAPLVVAAEQVRPIWQRLARRGEALGGGVALPAVSREPELRLRADAQILRPAAVQGDRAIFVPPRGSRPLQLLSRAASPHTVRPWLDDRRSLGVAVRAITLWRDEHRLAIPLDHPDLADGWWPPEADANRHWRWTNGAANLPAADMIELLLHDTGSYPAAAPARGSASAAHAGPGR